ncbi:MAG TPA: class I adenylate-forming enzyme family protein [Allosphingosinicella sp.]
MLEEQARTQANRPFLVIDDTQLDFGEVYARALRLARGLVELGLRPGDRVAVLMPNSIEAALVFYASHLAGATAVPINARFKRRELRHIITHCDARFLFTTQSVREHVDFVALIWDAVEGLATAAAGEPLALSSAPELRHVIVCGGESPSPAVGWDEVEAAGDATAKSGLSPFDVPTCGSDIAFLLYTSGTTALPKGCELTHAAVISSWRSYAEIIGLSADAGIWSPCPFFHIGGIGPMTSALLRGTRFLSTTRFEPGSAVEMLRRHRPRHLFPAFPTLTLATLREEAFDPQNFTFIETVVNVSPPETQQLIQRLLPSGTKLLNDFGMTEASGIVTMTRPSDDDSRRLNSNGRPLPGIEVRIVDPSKGEVLPSGAHGEIQFRGNNALRSYYKDPEATSRTIDGDGWVTTSDLGCVDANGDLHFIGRLKDILKVGGENVAPAEIEAHLSTHPGVRMAQVVGRPDKKYGEVPVAFVELLPGRVADEGEIIAFCRGHLASFKVPREVRFIEDWPMSASKVQKFRLREMLAL